jgi:hypothetical protein
LVAGFCAPTRETFDAQHEAKVERFWSCDDENAPVSSLNHPSKFDQNALKKNSEYSTAIARRAPRRRMFITWPPSFRALILSNESTTNSPVKRVRRQCKNEPRAHQAEMRVVHLLSASRLRCRGTAKSNDAGARSVTKIKAQMIPRVA